MPCVPHTGVDFHPKLQDRTCVLRQMMYGHVPAAFVCAHKSCPGRLKMPSKVKIMKNTFQNAPKDNLLGAMIQVFQENDNELTISQVAALLPDKLGVEPKDIDSREVEKTLKSYASQTIACEPEQDATLCIFQDLGDGAYALNADDEQIASLEMEDGAAVVSDVIPEEQIASVSDAKEWNRREEFADNAGRKYGGDTSEWPEDTSDDGLNTDFAFNASAAVEGENAVFGSDAMDQPHVYGDDPYDQADNQQAALEREARFANDQAAQMSADQPETVVSPETAAGSYEQGMEFEADQEVLPQADVTVTAIDAEAETFASAQASKQAEIDDLNDQLAQAKSDLEKANARADQAERDTHQANAEMEGYRKTAVKAQKAADRAQDKLDDLDDASQLRKDTDKMLRKVTKAEDRIDQQKRKIEDHADQIEQSSSGMMKALHKAQIRHDKKVIDRKERKIDRILQDVQDDQATAEMTSAIK